MSTNRCPSKFKASLTVHLLEAEYPTHQRNVVFKSQQHFPNWRSIHNITNTEENCRMTQRPQINFKTTSPLSADNGANSLPSDSEGTARWWNCNPLDHLMEPIALGDSAPFTGWTPQGAVPSWANLPSPHYSPPLPIFSHYLYSTYTI